MTLAIDDNAPIKDAPALTEAGPKSISLTGWKDILLSVLGRIGDDRAMLIAAGVTYFLLLAIFPAVTTFISIYGLFADPLSVAKQLDFLVGVVPSGGLDIIRDQLTRLTLHGAPTLSLALIASLAVALWSASAGVRSLFDAMNAVYNQREKRNIVWIFSLSILFTLAGAIVAAVMFSVVVAIPAALSVIGFGKDYAWIAQLAGYAVLIALLFLSLAVLYRFGPSRVGARWRWVTPGSAFAVILIGIVSALYSWYASNFAHYDQTYGSLGALIGFLFWLWITLTVVIVGAELDVAIAAYRAGTLSPAVPHTPADRPTISEAMGPSPQKQRAAYGRVGRWASRVDEAIPLSPTQKRLLPLYAAVPLGILVGLLVASNANARRP